MSDLAKVLESRLLDHSGNWIQRQVSILILIASTEYDGAFFPQKCNTVAAYLLVETR